MQLKRLLGTFVQVEFEKEETEVKSGGGIILTNPDKKSYKSAIVRMVGEKCEMDLQVGDYVIVNNYHENLKVGDSVIVKELDIVAVK